MTVRSECSAIAKPTWRRAPPSAAVLWCTLAALFPTHAAAQAAETAPASPAAAAPKTDSEINAEDAQSDAQQVAAKTLQDRIRAVSRRVFLKRQRFELVPGFGFQTNDPFSRPFSIGARASYHFNEEFALDFGGAYAPPFFVQQLQDVRLLGGDAADLQKARDTTAIMAGYVDGGVTFSPFYGKLALMAEQVLHFDGFVSAGLGVTFDNSDNFIHPALELGLGGRVFLLKWLTVRADLRNYIYPLIQNNTLSFPSLLILSLGVGIHIPFDFDYSTEVIGAKG